MINLSIAEKVAIFMNRPTMMNSHVTAYPSIMDCLEYKKKLINESTDDYVRVESESIPARKKEVK